jgi:hypothetical protein
MGASDPTGSQHAGSEDHKMSTTATSGDSSGRVDVFRADSDVDTSPGGNRRQKESKSRDQTVRTGVVSNFMRRDGSGRRHSDHSYKGACTKVLPLVRNRSIVGTGEDHKPQETISQCNDDTLSKKPYKADERGSGSPVREPEHCRSCPKLFTTEQSTSSSNLSSKPLCGQDTHEEDVTCRNEQKSCSMPKSALSLDDKYYKCQITDTDSKNYFHIRDQSLDNCHQIQGLTYNIHNQMSETKKNVKEQCKVKEHGIQNDVVGNDHIHGNSIDQNLSVCQSSSTVRNMNCDCSKSSSSKNYLNST